MVSIAARNECFRSRKKTGLNKNVTQTKAKLMEHKNEDDLSILKDAFLVAG